MSLYGWRNGSLVCISSFSKLTFNKASWCLRKISRRIHHFSSTSRFERCNQNRELTFRSVRAELETPLYASVTQITFPRGSYCRDCKKICLWSMQRDTADCIRRSSFVLLFYVLSAISIILGSLLNFRANKRYSLFRIDIRRSYRLHRLIYKTKKGSKL